jgi:hypothetical protein
MRLHPVWGLILFFLAALATGSLAYGADPPRGIPAGYELRDIEGFTVYVSKTVLQQPRDRWSREPLSVLEHELNDLRRILVPRIVKVLQDVPIWVEWDDKSPAVAGAVAVYYHGNAEGMKKLGVDPRKVNCIDVVTLRVLGEMRHPGTALQQIVILHEMAHAVHHRLLGVDNPELEATFQQACDRKLYDNVNDRFGRRTRAYARTNAAEYFAEISCAYLDSCNYFPFNYTELFGYDPAGFAFVERVWKHPERFNVIAGKQAPGWGRSAGTAAASRADVFAERDAQLKLDRLRTQANDGHADDAKKGLQDLVRKFPGTAAADDARKLLKSLN